jgi:hypothetical protein
MVHNKARVEGCIAEAFACKEISNFSSMYFSCANNVNAVGRISRSYCTSHVVATTFDRISAAFGSRLLASPPTPVSRSAWRHCSLTDGTGVLAVTDAVGISTWTAGVITLWITSVEDTAASTYNFHATHSKTSLCRNMFRMFT